jgi:hypothetical protein
VTAAIALAMQDGPRDAQSLVKLLGHAALDMGAGGKDPAFGWGLIAAPSACGLRNRAS